MKRPLLVFISLLTLLSLFGCRAPESTAVPTPSPSVTAVPTASPSPAPSPGSDESLSPDLSLFPAFSVKEAGKLLTLCTAGSAKATAALFLKAGVSVLKQGNFDKDVLDRSHTCAYTVGGLTDENGQDYLLVAVRGTSGGEWYSNFDVLPSRELSSDYSENFLLSAQDVLEGLKPLLTDQTRVIVCGHSRGAACANLLGVLLEELLGPDRYCAYTFASPPTVRGAAASKVYAHIYNIVNTGDLVTEVPFTAWGFRRAGQDLVPEGDPALTAVVRTLVTALTVAVPDADTYYNKHYPVNAPGFPEEGVTPYDFTVVLADMLITRNFVLDSPLWTACPGLAPLADAFRAAAESGQLVRVGLEHAPARYHALLASMEK